MPVDVLSLQVDGLLTNLALEYQNKAFIADRVLPPRPVPNKAGKYKAYSQADEFLIDDALIGPNSPANEIGYKVTEDTFACDDYGLKTWVSQEEIDNAVAPLAPMRKAVQKVMRHIMRRRERRVAQAVLNTANYATANKLDVQGAWATTSTDVVSQLQTGVDACAAPPNTMVIDLKSFRALQRNEKLLAAIKGTLQPQMIGSAETPKMEGDPMAAASVSVTSLAAFLGLDLVLIGAATMATSVKGQTLTKGLIWDLPNATKGGAALLRVSQQDIDDVIWGAQFVWKPPQVRQWNDPDRGAFGSTAVHVAESSTVKVIANDAGYLFHDTLLT